MSPFFGMIKVFYDLGKYDDAMIVKFCDAGKLTKTEVKTLTGKSYTVLTTI